MKHQGLLHGIEKMTRADLAALKPGPWTGISEFREVLETAAKTQSEKLQADYERELESIMRPGLENLYAGRLIAMVEQAATKQHAEHFREFAAECRQVGVSPLPARSIFVASYIHFHKINGTDVKPIAQAISYAHMLKGHGDPCADPLVRVMLDDSAPTKRKKKANGTAHVEEPTDDPLVDASTKELH